MRVDEVRVEELSQTVPILGRLVTRRSGEVAARIEGPVEVFDVQPGDRLNEGDPIAWLDDAVLRARLASARSRQTQAEARLRTSEAEANLRRYEARRAEGLKGSAAFNQARLDDAYQNVAIAEAQRGEAASAIEAARADVELAETQLRYTRIEAPYDGTVVARMTEKGAFVQAGEPIVELVSDRDFEVEAEVPNNRLDGLEVGERVTFTLDDGTSHPALVRALLPSENPLTRTRAVRFAPVFGPVLAGSSSQVANNQSVQVEIPLGGAESILTVSKDAIIKRADQSLVYLFENGTAAIRPVVLGRAVGDRFEVLSGLAPGDLAVVRGNERLQPGQPIRIGNAAAPQSSERPEPVGTGSGDAGSSG